jgi:hypothetical protein
MDVSAEMEEEDDARAMVWSRLLRRIDDRRRLRVVVS